MAVKVSNLKVALQNGTDSTLVATWDFKNTTTSASTSSSKPKVGDKVTIKSGAKWYNGSAIPSWVMSKQWIVYEVEGNRAVINKSSDGAYKIMSPINVNNLTVVKSTTTYTTINNLDHYKVQWYYDSGNGVWFDGGSSDVTLKNATYNAPSNAIKVKVLVKPVSKTYTKNNKTVSYWTGTSTSLTYLMSNNPPSQLSAPTVELNKYNLTAKIENIEDAKAEKVEFEIYKENTKFKSSIQSVITARASYTCAITAGSKYRVRCRAINMVGSTKVYGEWSPYSSEVSTIPASVTNVKCVVESETSVRVSWTGSSTATSYKVEYTTKREYFDSSSEVSSITVENTYAYITGLETGEEWYFRVCAVNDDGESGWSDIVYKVIGSKPEAPTTWSLTTTAIIGEAVILYWVHNTEDGSKQTQAQIELVINNKANIVTIDVDPDVSSNDEEEKIYSYNLDLSEYTEGAEVLWRVRTRGITAEYSDWSVQRAIDIYAPPVASVELGDGSGILAAFPYSIAVTSGPDTQKGITYHISIVAEDSYETEDQIGNPVLVNAGTEVYSKLFTVMGNSFTHDLMPEEIVLENNQAYTVNITVSMDSGLTAETNGMFTVVWDDDNYDPDAEISIDEEVLCAYITPYCIDPDNVMVENIVLSVYRRNFDGSFTEIATGITNDGVTTVVDPHPSLDYARYRIVARNVNTNVCGYSDLPGIPMNAPSIIIQWDEMWSQFDFSGEDEVETPPWTGSMLRLHYNVDVSEDTDPDVSLIEYAGRKNPVSYYGTQKGVSQTWSTDVPKEDSETIYALRRLSVWAGDVYVRETSGNGFWANIKVSMNKKHDSLVVPVTLDITRVEGDLP